MERLRPHLDLGRRLTLEIPPDSIDTHLLRALEGELPSRRYNDAVRLEVAENCPEEISNFLLEQFKLTQDALYKVNGPVNLNRLLQIHDLVDRPDLVYPGPYCGCRSPVPWLSAILVQCPFLDNSHLVYKYIKKLPNLVTWVKQLMLPT